MQTRETIIKKGLKTLGYKYDPVLDAFINQKYPDAPLRVDYKTLTCHGASPADGSLGCLTDWLSEPYVGQLLKTMGFQCCFKYDRDPYEEDYTVYTHCDLSYGIRSYRGSLYKNGFQITFENIMQNLAKRSSKKNDNDFKKTNTKSIRNPWLQI